MNLIITAGGTSERIDTVRTITNNATGRLGSLIAEEFSRKLIHKTHKIYYLCGIGAVVPTLENVDTQIIRIEGTQQLQSEMNRLLNTQSINAVIHSMAVSDYKVASITTAGLLAQDIVKEANRFSELTTKEEWQKLILGALQKQSIFGEQKISSELENPLLILEKTPKIIGMIKQISPQTILVGFKLLSGVSKEELIETAYQLLKRNKCDYVFANDMTSMKDGNQEGYLIDERGDYKKLISKRQIAEEIVDSILKKMEVQIEKHYNRGDGKYSSI